MKLKVYYRALFAGMLVFGVLEELYLRRWLFHHLGYGSVIAGSLPNFIAVLLFSTALTAIRLPATGLAIVRMIAAVVSGLVLYEVAQIWMPHRTFDWNDIGATLLGGVVAWLLLVLPRRIREWRTV